MIVIITIIWSISIKCSNFYFGNVLRPCFSIATVTFYDIGYISSKKGYVRYVATNLKGHNLGIDSTAFTSSMEKRGANVIPILPSHACYSNVWYLSGFLRHAMHN
jgi:hypothetical protein